MIELMDANCRIGRGPADPEDAPVTAQRLRDLMDRFGVTRAVVFHSAAEYSDAAFGNALLPRETGNDPRFLPQWAALPAVWGAFPAPEELLSRMKAAGVSSVRLFPARYGHSLRRYAAGPLLDALAEAKVPVFISLSELKNDWDALFDLCSDYPETRFVLCAPGYRCLRQLVPILQARPNLWVDTSNFLIHNGIREFCHQLGARRLLFGSGAPETSLAAAASQLLLSDISAEEKQMIGAENLRALLKEATL